MTLLPAVKDTAIISEIVSGVLFVVLLATACVTDLRERRIPNRLVLVLLVGGMLSSFVASPSVGGVGRAIAAGLLGFAIWIPAYALRMLGAGDVKFFAAAAVWLAPVQVAHAAVYTALAGAALSVLWLVLEHGPAYGLSRALFVYQTPFAAAAQSRVAGPARRHVPYGIAMAVGLTLTVWLPRIR